MVVELHRFVPASDVAIDKWLAAAKWIAINAWHCGSFLVVYNFKRSTPRWESVTGGMEPGEKPEDAARRELLEESGQKCGALDFRGVFQITDPASGWVSEPCAFFSTILSEVHPFIPNSETSALEFVLNPETQLERFSKLTGQLLLLEPASRREL